MIINKIIIVKSILLMLLIQPAFAASKDDFQKLNEIKEKLRQEKITRINDKVDSYNKIKSLEMKIYSLDDRRVELNKKKINLEQKNDTLRQELNKLQDEYDKTELTVAGVNQFLTEKAEELEKKIESGFPYYKHERIKKVDSLKQIAAKKRSTEAMRELFQILSKELEITKTSEIYKTEIDGEKAKVLRIGGIFSAYKSINDNTIALLRKRVKEGELAYKWENKLSPSDREKLKKLFQSIEKPQENNILLPLDVAQGKKTDTGEASGKGFMNWFKKGGPVMFPIAIVGILVVVLCIERAIVFWKEFIVADELSERVVELWRKDHKDDAVKLCRDTRGPVARMLGEGLKQHEKGKRAVEESIHEVTLHELPKLEKYLSTISVLAAVAPLLGLLGTVTGMINTFNVITYHGGGDPRLLAGGISEAMITTEAGLIIAIPAVLIHDYLSSKADKIISDMEKSAAKLINNLPDLPFESSGGI